MNDPGSHPRLGHYDVLEAPLVGKGVLELRPGEKTFNIYLCRKGGLASRR